MWLCAYVVMCLCGYLLLQYNSNLQRKLTYNMPMCAAIGCKNTNDHERKSEEQLNIEKTYKISFHT